jgi:hypothetical protein
MNLTDEQKSKVREWLNEGLSVADVQSKMSDELSLSITYMELRFLLDDLRLAPQDAEEPEPEIEAPAPVPAPAPAPDAPATAGEAELPPPDDAAAGTAGGVSLTVDQLVRPGAMASGKVTFSDGKKADWYIDEMGRLGLAAEEDGYKPPEADVMDFQNKLQQELSKLGMG